MRRRFDASWPALQRAIRKAAALRLDDVCPGFQTLFSSRTFQEPLEEGTDQAWISRYDDKRGASMAIRRHLPAVEKCCEPWQLWLYQKLLSQLDGYTLDIRENLIEERRFELSDEVKVDFTRPCTPAAPRQVGSTTRSGSCNPKVRRSIKPRSA